MYSLIRCLVEILVEEVKKNNVVKIKCLRHLIASLSNMIEPKYIDIAFSGIVYDRKIYLEIAKEALEKIDTSFKNVYDVNLQIEVLKDFIKENESND